MSIRESLSAERKVLQEQGLLPLWFSTDGFQLYKEKYSVEGEASFKGRAETIARTAASYLKDSASWEKKFFELIWKGWMSCSTPVLSNMGTNKGLPVSCSGQYIDDSVDSFYVNLREAAILTQNGFGTSAYLGDIRPRGSKISRGGRASGVVPVFDDFVNMSMKITQGTRRGSWAGSIPISHGDFDELADYIKNHPDSANVGWIWTDEDTKKCNDGDEETLRRFRKVMKLKLLSGKGYITFVDKINRQNPQMYKDAQLLVQSSNLCQEICLFQDNEHTYTCVLSAMNLVHYNEWKNTDAIFNATVFLDCVAEDFIQKGGKIPGLDKAVKFTQKSRALGLGVCGFHTYLQENSIPFESLKAAYFNNEVFKKLNDESLKASKWMAKEYGEPQLCTGYGVRSTHRLALMPTLSTALIMGGCSQTTEPIIGNVFVQNSAGGESERINPTFLKLMKKHGKHTKKLAKEIADRNGSVQHLDWLTPEEKLVFRTAFEINQEVIIRLASQRQKYICQGQSINLFFSAEETEENIAKIHRIAIEDEGIKSLYYVRTQSGVSASTGECVACQ